MKKRKPNRLQGYDYSTDNLYFVTSCAHNRICCFGDIVRTGHVMVGTGRDPSLPPTFNQQMILNEYGTIAKKQWHWLGEQYPYVVLHEFVVMPNNIHGIIEINRSNVGPGRNVGTGRVMVGTGRDVPKIKSLSELMGAYKTTVSKQIHLIGFPEFKWQRSFYEHIIRDDKSFETISDYIMNNPIKWEQDNFYNL